MATTQLQSTFSGAVRLADVSDYIAPSQACVVSVGPPKPAKDEGEVSLQSRFSNNRGGITSASGAEEPVKVTLNDCLACSGCVTSAETVLLEQQSTQEFLRVLATKAAEDRVVVVTLSSQSRTSLAAHYGLSPLETTAKLSGFLKRLGVDFVLEDVTGRDLALLSTLEEFWERYTSKSDRARLPLLTSECPGWVLYAEKTHGKLVLPYMSKSKSAIAILGSLTKRILPANLGVDPSRVYHCFVSPCFDKKLEASRDDLKTGEFADLDCVLATTEFDELLRTKAFDASSCEPLPLDDLFRGQGRETKVHSSSRGSSGGYLEFVFRECARRLKGEAGLFPVDEPLPLTVVRNQDFQEICIKGEDGKVVLHFALAYGFRNIQNIIRRIKQKKASFHFVEIMACPSGCLNGGGQMKEDNADGMRSIDRKEILSQLEALYHHSEVEQRDPRGSQSTAEVEKWLGGFETQEASQVLRTEFHDRSQKQSEAAPMVIDF